LNLLPSNLRPHAISELLNANASTAPSWLATIDRGVASAVHASGYGSVLVIVAVELGIGLLVFGNRVIREVALWAGILAAGLFWAVGQTFGQLFSGQATDPNTGPLLILVGLAALGATRHQAGAEADGVAPNRELADMAA